MKLKKELTLIDVLSITIGAMMSSGLFILPGLAHAHAGPAILVSYLLAGVLAGAGMLSQAELASAMPKTGGTYFYVMRSMGPAVGTIYGLITFFALALKSAFELIGMASFTAMIIDVDVKVAAATLCAVFILINLFGTKGAGRIQVIMVSCIITALLIYVVRGVPNIDIKHFEPFAPGGHMSILATAGFVFVSYGGLLKVASLAEEIKDPGRVLPLGMIISSVVVAAIYLSVIFVTTGTGTLGAIGQSDVSLTPISDGAAAFMGGYGSIILSIAAVLAFAAAANAGIMGASRYLLALSKDDLLPGFFGDINHKYHTPHFSILATGAFMLAALFLEIEVIVKAASCVLILTYIFSCLANIIMRESHLQNYQPKFRAPLYPYVPIAGIIGFGFLLFTIGAQALLMSLALVVAGLFIYWFYGRAMAKKEYALLHLIERITAKELTDHSLETELKEIIHERDEIVKDRFDQIIDDCKILDIEGPMSAEQLFKLVADEMSEGLPVGPDVFFNLLVEREKDSSTVIRPGLAIPHIIIEGEKHFDILLVRCREGISFPESEESVNTVFVLTGTRDERNFHLRALSAIAQIVMDPNFEKKWMAAKSEEALRDVVLLGKRRR